MRISQAPVKMPLIGEGGSVGKGWIDWFLNVSSALKGTFTRAKEFAITPWSIQVNQRVEIGTQTWTSPVPVNDGVVAITKFNGSGNEIATERVVTEDDSVNLPEITEGFVYVSAVLIRR